MAAKLSQRVYFKEWRLHRGLTQKQVIDRLREIQEETAPQTEASLSRLENRKQPYSEAVLGALAQVYDCEPKDLIGVNPAKDGDVVDLLRHMTDKQHDQAVALIRAIYATM
jgi:transcriptional regulator with XRE-family HTH domain